MSRLRVCLILSLILLCFASFGFADNIDYNYLGNGGQWSWTGGVGSVLSATANFVQVSKNSSVPIYGLSGATLSFQTGGALGGDGSFANPFRWDPGYSPITVYIPSALTINTGSGSVTITGGDSFLGYFRDITAAFNAFGGLNFGGNFVAGTVDPSILTLLGFPADTPTDVSGRLSGNFDASGAVTFANGGFGRVGSGDLIVTPVPEQGTLILFGAGMLLLSAVLRSRLLKPGTR